MNDYVNRSCDASSRFCCRFLAGAVDWRNARVSAPSYRRVSARWIILAGCAPRPGEVGYDDAANPIAAVRPLAVVGFRQISSVDTDE